MQKNENKVLKVTVFAGWMFFVGMFIGRVIAIVLTHDDVTNFGELMYRLDLLNLFDISFLAFLVFATILYLINKKGTGKILGKVEQLSAKSWTYQHGENAIVIKNSMTSMELTVNGEVQDTVKGVITINARLSCKLKDGEDLIALNEHDKWRVHVGKELEEVRQ